MPTGLVRCNWFCSHMLLCLLLLLATHCQGEEEVPNGVAENPEAKPSPAEQAMAGFQVPPGWKGSVAAEEPDAANVVAFTFDEQGRMYLAETFRQGKGVVDNRGNMHWLLDDLAAQTVADRLAYLHKHVGDDLSAYTAQEDRVRQLADTDGDGKFETVRVFADSFNDVLDGTGAGLLAVDGNVYYTCIPHVWRLQDADDNGEAETRESLHYGYGVRFAFRGHDSHGLTLGPDGKVYFSIGDRGYHLELKDGRTLAHPDQGAVFRCNLDGSGLEEFATGLRNPQELAFDEFGNLFTGDNNSDGGDKARWVDVVEGSDSGWRMYYQYLDDRGPWNREFLWHPPRPDQPAYLLPPITNFADGPSGLTYNPGDSLGEKYRGMFFLADFRGSPANSGIRGFRVQPKGASFELIDAEETVWSILATDVEFGYDGAMYISDWIDGWEGTGNSRIYRFTPPESVAPSTPSDVPSTAELFRAGFAERSPAELAELLQHSDYRVRQRAQLALVKANESALLFQTLTSTKRTQPRLHAIWGLGQLAAQDPQIVAPLAGTLLDPDAHVRAQAARVLGQARFLPATEALTELLKDVQPRVRLEAALALGKIGSPSAVPALLEMLTEANDQDAALRHAGVMGLVVCATPVELAGLANHPAKPIRLAAVVALRRLANPAVGTFLTDSEPFVVNEAVLAIHDVAISDALPVLAGLEAVPAFSEATLLRIVSANFQIGSAEALARVIQLASRAELPTSVRRLALSAIRQWNSPPPLNLVTNRYEPPAARTVDVTVALAPALPALLSAESTISEAATELAGQYGINEVEPYLVTVFEQADRAPSERTAALLALSALNSGELARLTELALTSETASLRNTGRKLLGKLDPARAVTAVREILTQGEQIEQQAALTLLGELASEEADTLLADQLRLALAGTLAPEVELDLLEAARLRATPVLAELITQYDTHLAQQGRWGVYTPTLVGGSYERGEAIFLGRTEVSCRRCHKVAGNGGDVGPDLTKIAMTQTREYLLEAIIDPNKAIAKGYETKALALADGRVVAGIVRNDNGTQLQLMQPTGELITIEKSEIEEEASGKSGMPEDLVKKLSLRDIRDLVAYLAQLKGQPAGEHGTSHGTPEADAREESVAEPISSATAPSVVTPLRETPAQEPPASATPAIAKPAQAAPLRTAPRKTNLKKRSPQKRAPKQIAPTRSAP